MKTLFFSLCTLFFFNAQAQYNINALKFSTTQAFEQFVDSKSLANLQNIDGFTTYQPLKTTFAAEPLPPAELSQNLPDDDYDISKDAVPVNGKNDYSVIPLLSDILNTDKVVIIGNWIVKLELENDRALILNKINSSQYNDLISGNTNNPNVLSFSTEDDGIEILNQLDNGVSMASLRLWCSDRYAQGSSNTVVAYNGNRKRLHMEVFYRPAFFIFTLKGNAKAQKRFLRIWWKDWTGIVNMQYLDLRYNVRCNKIPGFNFQGNPNGQPGFGGLVSNQPVSEFLAYQTTRALKNYTYVIDFISDNHGSGHVEISNY
jgi:hypothetical protein